MQTFLPYPNFEKSAKCLDYRRLGNQRVETFQIIEALEGRSKGWRNHPATIMWEGYVPALKLYFEIFIEEWVARGYKNTLKLYPKTNSKIEMPWWHRWDEFHASHRSNLLRKLPEHYGKFGWKESNDLPYIWPDRLDSIVKLV